MELRVTLTGTRPLLMHNGRLANPIDPWTRRLREVTSRRRKTDEDLAEQIHVEARGGCWDTSDGLLGVPSAALWSSLHEAAKFFRRGADVERALVTDDLVMPLAIDGAKVSADDWVTDFEHIDVRPARLRGQRVLRARAIIPAGWQSTHCFELLTDVMDARDLDPIVERAGRLVGVGDWRPMHGTYTARVEQ